MRDGSEYQPLNVDDSDTVPPPTLKNRKRRKIQICLLFTFCLALFGLAPMPMGRYDLSHHHMHSDSEGAKYSDKPGTLLSVPCEPAVDNVECGFLIVPKDHFNETVGTAKIAIARYKAKKNPKKGIVFMNPGGPGHPGTYLAMQKGDEMAQIIGEDWDLVGFDPRGVGKTIPSTRCFSDIQSYRDMFANTVVERGITVPSIKDLSSPDLREALLLQYEELLSLKRAQGGICRDSMGDELAYMGSATVARDVEFMSRILDGKDTPVNYWGESYGTVIGSFLVNLFPERIGRVVIDGVVNPVLLTTEPTHKWPSNWLLDAEKTYGIFLEDCSEAGPERCPLALSQGELPEAIERRLEFFFDETARRPIPVPDGHRPGVLTSGTARALLLISLQNPKHWVATAQNFAEAMKGNATALYNIHIPPPLSPNTSFTDILPPFTPDLQRQAITCLDSPPPYPPDEAYPSAEDYTEQGLFTLNTVSRHFGASTGVGEPDGGCEWWPVKRREEDNVNFGNANGKLKDDGKILVISNTADPITPLSSGVLVNSLLPDSSVLAIQDGPGHCSTSFPSECIRQIQRDYFAGRLPKNGTVCKVEKGAFAV